MRKIRVSLYCYSSYCSHCEDLLHPGEGNPREIICRKDSCGAVRELKEGRR